MLRTVEQGRCREIIDNRTTVHDVYIQCVLKLLNDTLTFCIPRASKTAPKTYDKTLKKL